MMLEHNTYKEAISDVKLTEEAGMEMLENAMRRKQQWSQRWRVKTAAVVAGIFVVVLSANGICFAATGMNAWDFFQHIYRSTSEETEVLARNFREAGQTLVDGNVQYTMENYWYDVDAGMVYYTIRTDSLDGKPLSEDEDAYYAEPKFNWISGSSSVGFESVVSEDKLSIRRLYHVLISHPKDAQEVYWRPEVEAGASKDSLVVNIQAKNSEENENGGVRNATITIKGEEGYVEEDVLSTYKDIGGFVLEPTELMKMKRLNIDYSVLENCTGLDITGGGMQVFFKTKYGEEKIIYPFGYMELKMKDGSSCYVVEDETRLPEGNWKIQSNKDGQITGWKSETMDITGDRYLGGGFGGGSGDDGMHVDYEFSGMFNRFIEIDDVAAVYIDGVELPMR